jgi:TonB family protein
MTWAHYLLQVNIYLVLFYAFYKLLLDKETYFIMNRFYLLTSGVLSLTIPFIKPEWFSKQPVTQHLKTSVNQLQMMITQVNNSADEAASFNWGQLAGGLYIFGMLFFLFRFIFQLAAVKKMIQERPVGAAFSFFRKKVIDQALPGLETIHQHEEIHSRQLHTLDVLFFELIAILVWCNPIVYLYKKSVKAIHEYLADEEAARFEGDKESYALLLLSKAFGIEQNILTNSFYNQSLIKKRIIMLHKERSKKTAVLKYGMVLPLFAITLLFSSATIRSNEELKSVAEKIIAPVIEIPAPPAEVIHIKEKRAALLLPENWKAFYKYLSAAVNYPRAAHEKQLQGNTMVKFVVSSGEVNGISVVTPLGLGCDAQVMKSILGYNGFNNVKDGKYCITVGFRLSDATSTIKNKMIVAPAGYNQLDELIVTGYSSNKATTAVQDKAKALSEVVVAGYENNRSEQEPKVFDFVSIETPPSFPGGMNKFYEYLSKNVKYPKEAQNNNIQGKVFLSFIVEQDGTIADVQVVRRLGGGTDEEAVRLLQESPKWVPGILNGKTVRVKYNIPISFTLTTDKPKKP